VFLLKGISANDGHTMQRQSVQQSTESCTNAKTSASFERTVEMSRFILVAILLMFSFVTGCATASGALYFSPTPDVVTVPVSTATIEPTLIIKTVLPASTATMPQWTPMPLSTATSTAESQRKVLEKWQIEFTFSGGIAGLRRIVELSDTGQLTVTDQKINRRVAAHVSETELSEIATLVANAQSVTPSGRLPNCRDCFEYGLGISMDGQRFLFKVNDMSLTESGLESLIKALVRLQDKALSGQKP
jgi:hypothetical protein